MSTLPDLVRPFVAERFAHRLDLSPLLSPPYDVVSPEQRTELAARDPSNIVHVILPEGPGDRYQHAARLLATWRRAGTLQRDPAPTVTVLRQRFTTPDGGVHARTGLIAAVCAEPYDRGRVRPHERTHRGPKEDRLRLMRATQTALEPLFFLSRDAGGGLEELLRRETSRAPEAEARLADVALSLWIVPADRAGSALESLRSEPLYIADGHHRYETAAAHAAERPAADWTMGLIVGANDPGLVVLPTHRVVLGGTADTAELERTVAAATDSTRVSEHDCAVVWPDGTEVPVRLRRDGGPAAPLVALAERVLVTPLLRRSAGGELVYTHDADTARSLVATGGVAVLLPATPIADVLSVADAGGIMPPKSTFFYPKVPSGLMLGPLA